MVHAAQGYYPLQWAALNNRVGIASYLLENGYVIDRAYSQGQTALHWAAVRGSLSAAETLLRASADLTLADSKGYGRNLLRSLHKNATHQVQGLQVSPTGALQSCLDEELSCTWIGAELYHGVLGAPSVNLMQP